MSRNLIALQNKFLGHGQTVYDLLAQIHEKNGCVTDEDIETLARDHQLPPAHVRSTAKFYEELAHETATRHHVQVCVGEACRAGGCDRLRSKVDERARALSQRVGPDQLRVSDVACLGYCGHGPNAMVDGRPIQVEDDSALDRIFAYVEGKAPELGLVEPHNHVQQPSEGQPNVLLRRMDEPNVTSLVGARAAGIYGSFEKAVTGMAPAAVIECVKTSQLRGRGGAGFPTGIKFQTVADSTAPDGSGRKFVVVNFDEGDAGSYIDKELVELDPHGQLEGILIAAYAVGAREAIIYARKEYPRARAVLQTAIDEARAGGLIATAVFGSDFACDVRIVEGQGAYICGEETSLLRSLEGVPALVSIRPPFPAQEGLWRCPTAVNNVETLHNLPWIIEHGGEAYAALGYGRSRGTKAISLNSRVRKPGVYEVEFGVTLRHIIEDIGGGMAEGEHFKAVQIGGPLGGILPESMLDTPLDFEALAAVKGIVGHAGIVVYSQNDDLVAIARGLMHFCAVESCGKCFPCRIGSVRGTELIDRMVEDGVTEARLQLMRELCETMKYGSLCAMGGMTPVPIECIMEYFPEELERHRKTTAHSGLVQLSNPARV